MKKLFFLVATIFALSCTADTPITVDYNLFGRQCTGTARTHQEMAIDRLAGIALDACVQQGFNENCAVDAVSQTPAGGCGHNKGGYTRVSVKCLKSTDGGTKK